MDRRALVASSFLALATAGCGTTVSGTTAAQNSSLPGGTSDSLSVPSTTAGGNALSAGGVGTDATGLAATADSNTSGGVGGSGASALTAPGTAGADSTTSVEQGVGVTDTAIYVGIGYTTNGDAANAALGASKITSGDERADAEAVIADINAHGGVANRKLVPVFHATNAQSQQTKATQDQEACSDYTQDHQVFAATDAGYTENFMTCLTKAGVVDVHSGTLLDPDQAMFRRYPYYVDAGTISQDRADAALVTSLVRQHYFTGWNTTLGKPSSDKVKVGVLGVDVPEWTRPINNVLLPALKAAGFPVAPEDVVNIYNPGSTAEDGITLRDIQNAVLKFRQDGVTHVILLDTGGQLLTFFGKDAKSQHYYPRYGVHSGSGVQAIYDAGLVDSDQLNGTVGFAWDPTLDLSPRAADKYATSATVRCLKVIKERTGQTFDSTNAASLALSYCDELYLLADAIERVGAIINHDTFMAAIEATRGRFVPAAFPSMFFGLGRHDGVETGFDQKWDAGCKCVKFVTEAYRIP